MIWGAGDVRRYHPFWRFPYTYRQPMFIFSTGIRKLKTLFCDMRRWKMSLVFGGFPYTHHQPMFFFSKVIRRLKTLFCDMVCRRRRKMLPIFDGFPYTYHQPMFFFFSYAPFSSSFRLRPVFVKYNQKSILAQKFPNRWLHTSQTGAVHLIPMLTDTRQKSKINDPAPACTNREYDHDNRGPMESMDVQGIVKRLCQRERRTDHGRCSGKDYFAFEVQEYLVK